MIEAARPLAASKGWGRAAIGLTLWLLAGSVAAQSIELVSHNRLRVCADPADLPFSNDRREGFENRIAEIIGQDLGAPVDYVWFPRIGAFARNTLQKRQCDLVMGTVSGDDEMDTTDPYYHSGYMLVTRSDRHIDARRVDDPALAGKRIGLIAATPPTDLLLRHDMMGQVTTYSLTVDTRFESPARQLLQDVADGKIDAGLVWGPIAGYYIHHDAMKLTAVFLEGEPDSMRLDYHISMGVRAGEVDWRRRINQAIERRQPEIAAILAQYGVPKLDEQNRPVADPAGAAGP